MFIVQLIVRVIVSAFAAVIHDLHVIQENYFSSYKSDYGEKVNSKTCSQTLACD